MSITNDGKTFLITCNDLNDAKMTIIHEKDHKTLRVINLSKITHWLSVKGSSNWVGVNCVD